MWRSLALSIVAVVACAATAQAQTSARAVKLTPAQLAPAMAAYVERKIEERAELLGCAATQPKLRDAVPVAWDAWRKILIALLWANDFPAAHINAMATRTDPAKLDTAPSPNAVVCQAIAATNAAGKLSPDSWASEARDMFKRQEMISAVAEATEAQRARFNDLMAREKAEQARLLNCLALIDPQWLGLAMSDWANYVAQARAIALTTSLPRDQIVAQFAALEPNALLASLPRDRAEARKSCEASDAWQKRLYEFRMINIVGDTREIFTGKR